MSRKISAVLESILSFFANLSAVYILFACIASAVLVPFVVFARKNTIVDANSLYFLIAIALGIAILLVLTGVSRLRVLQEMKDDNVFTVVVAACFLVLFAIQMYVVKGGLFFAGWDVERICNFDNPPLDYYAKYPNQFFLSGVFRGIAGVAQYLGLDAYICLVVVGCLCVAVSMILIAFVGKEVGGFAVGYVTLAFDFALVGLSPWFLVPYSDAYGMLFTCFVLFFYVCVKNPVAKWFGMTVFAVIGYMIKPTIIFIFVAAIVVDAVFSLKTLGGHHASMQQRLKSGASIVAAVVLAVVLSFGVSAKVKDIGVEVNPESSFTATHFLMMGFNPVTKGVWNREDVAFSSSFATIEERQAANLQKWSERVSDYGPLGVAQLLLAKTLSNYSDGSFSWGMEGNFFYRTYGQDEAVKQFYGIADAAQGIERAAVFHAPMQILWFICLIGVSGCLLRRSKSKCETAMLIALMFLSGFLMLFECRARYLFLYSPYFVLLGVIGWREAASRMGALRVKRLGKGQLGANNRRKNAPNHAR